jgi:hypothetical protein
MAYKDSNGFERLGLKNLEIENAKIFAMHLSGDGMYKGPRTFCVEIPRVTVQDDNGDDILLEDKLLREDWPLRIRKVNPDYLEEGETPGYYLPVEARWEPFPPEIFTVTNNKVRQMDEDEVGSLDKRRFSKVNLVIHPREYPDRDTGEHRVKAFLREGYFYIEMSRFRQELAEREYPED